MKKTIFTLAIIFFTLTACTSALDEPVNNNDPSTPQISDYNPKPDDSNLIHDVVHLDSVSLLELESFPLQFVLMLKGNLPTPCHKLRISVEQPDAENKIVMDVYSVADPNTACILVLEPFKVNFPLGSYPKGHYSIWVNGERVTEFDA